MARPDSSGLKLIERLRSDSERQLNFRAVDDETGEDEYAGVGSILRQTREQHGLDLFSVASALRIQVSHLDAIESGSFHRLPGATYAVGFLRSYAEYLGLDSDTVVQRFKEETEIAPAQTKLVFPEPVEETRRPGLRTAFVTVLVAAGLYGGWVYLERHGQVPIETVSEPPQRFANLANEAEDKAPAPAASALPVPTVGVAATADADDSGQAPPATQTTDGEAAAPQTADAEGAVPEGAAGAAMTDEVPSSESTNTLAEADTPVPAGSTAQETATGAQSEDSGTATLGAVSNDGHRATTPMTTETQSGPATAASQSMAESRPAATPEPTRVQVAPAETEEAIARADAVAEQGSAGGGASAVEQAAAAEVASIDRPQNQREAEARESAADDTAATNDPDVIPETNSNQATAALIEGPNRQVRVAAQSSSSVAATTNVTAREQDDEDSAPSIPQIQARVEPPQPPAIPAAPPPAPRLEATSASDSDLAAGGEQPARRYRPQIYGATTNNARVIVRATADSWVQVQGADNELLLTRILRAGDTYYAPDRTDLVLMTGNAGAIEVVVDGEVLGTLGPVGAVRRNIGLNADTLRGFVQANGSAQR